MEFIDQDMNGARFERVRLHGAHLHRVQLNDAKLNRVDLSGAEIRGSALYDMKLIGVELVNVEIDGQVENVVINGVDVGPLIEAELTRRDPLHGELHPGDADGFRRTWAQLEQRWADLTERARALPEETLHASVDGEWSFIQTIRHLGFATAAWLQRTVQGEENPYQALDIPWDEHPDWPDEWRIPTDRGERPTLDEALVARQDRQRRMREHLATLTDADLEVTVTREEPGWPAYPDVPVSMALQTILLEEYHHHRYATRDLDALTTPNEEES